MGETRRYEAENRTADRECDVATNHAGYTGDGFMDFGGNGSWIEWNNVRTSGAGDYELEFRYGNGSSRNRSATIRVNGAAAGEVEFAPTGSWPTWSTAKLTVPLRRGTNTLTVQANSGAGGPNLDHVRVTSVDLCPDDATKLEPGSCGCGTPEGSCGGTAVTACVVGDEGQDVTLACSSGGSITAIDFASYGTATGSCESSFATSECHAERSEGIIEAACLGKERCNISGRNAVFGDPCPGTRKHLAVSYRCSSDAGEVKPGLLMQHFNGEWSNLPDFDSLEPDAESVATQIGVGPYANTERFGLLFTGHIQIDDAGAYEFELGSDDGSRLWIDGEPVVDNDGLHGFRTLTGSVDLDSGRHALRVEFFERTGGDRLRLRYRAAGGSFSEVPASMLSHGEGAGGGDDSTQPGLIRQHFDGEWTQLPDFDSLMPDSEGVAEAIGVGPYAGEERFGLLFTGSIRIDDGGVYEFELGSDDGSRLLIDGETVVDNDGLHGFVTRTGSVRLDRGGHALRVEFFERSGGERLRLRFRAQGGNFAEIPAALLSHGGTVSPPDDCPGDPNKTGPGACGCGTPDVDTDGDATADCEDGCPYDAAKLAPGECGCGVAETACGGPDGGGGGGGPTQPLTLPIEVLGEEGKVVSETLTLTDAQASRARELWLQINNMGYEDKASVRINGGAWLTLNHDTAQLQRQEAARGGMVHGGFNTIRLTIPTSGQLRPGNNTLSFRFNFSDGISMGYRVIGLNVLDGSGERLMRRSDFQTDDPADWSPPYADQASIDEGEQLWRYAGLTSNYLRSNGNWYAHSLPANEPIRATCADCHAQDGRDLEIFAYSNLSIIERAKFHGLSEDEGKKIASYIRSLSRLDKVGRYGRPWNPPYQPGPSIAQRPVHEWAAGAGLDAVLDDDRDMLQGMFGKTEGITKADVERYFDSDQMWNTARQPLAIQLPDWKHWLPLIHPKDAFSRNGYWESSKQYDPQEGYEALRRYLAERRGDYDTRLFNELHRFWQHYRQFLAQGSSDKQHWRTEDGDAFRRGLKSGVSMEMAANSLAKLMAVKFFELHHEFELQGIAPDLIDAAEQPRERQWLGRQYNVFEVPAHFTACFKDGSERCHNFEGQPRATGEYESTSWYQLQQVINPGIATSREVVPVDYNYQPTLILRASQTSGLMEPVRFYYSSNVMYQTRTRVEYFTPNDKAGFNMRTMGPWLFYGTDNRNNFERLPQGKIPGLLNDMQRGLGTMIVTAQIEQFLREMDKPRNDLSLWDRRSSTSSGEHRALDPIDLTTSDMPRLDRPFSGELRHYAHKIYWTIPKFIELGVDCAVIEELKDWSSRAWPRVNWDRFECN